LLDVKFHVAQNIVSQLSLGNLAGIQSKIFDGAAHRNSPGILAVEKFVVNPAHQRPATDKRRAKANSLLLREAKDFNCKRQPTPIESLQQCNREHNSEHAIVGAGVWNRIEM
jgi:hypothetical protein